MIHHQLKQLVFNFRFQSLIISQKAQPSKYTLWDVLPCFVAYLYAKTGLHQMKLVH